MPAPIDPASKAPPGVKAAAARADELHKKVYSKEAPAAEVKPGEPAAPVAPTAPVAEAAPAAPVAPVDPVAPVTPAVTPEPAPDKNWEHAYQSMKGRHDRAAAQIKTMGEQITSMQNVISTMQVQDAGRPAPAAPDTTNMLTAEEIKDYGEDFLKVVAKKVAAETATLRTELSTLKNQLGAVTNNVTVSAREKMEAALDGAVSTWREINHDPRFHEWLAFTDSFSGAIRHNLLRQAWERNDSPRVLAIFKGFLDQEAASVPAGEIKPDPVKVPLESLAAPGRAKSAADTNNSPVEKPPVTRADITNFYLAVSKGAYRGRDDEKNALEQRIFAAEREGRIK